MVITWRARAGNDLVNCVEPEIIDPHVPGRITALAVYREAIDIWQGRKSHISAIGRSCHVGTDNPVMIGGIQCKTCNYSRYILGSLTGSYCCRSCIYCIAVRCCQSVFKGNGSGRVIRINCTIHGCGGTSYTCRSCGCCDRRNCC